MYLSDIQHIHHLKLGEYRPGTINESWLHIINNGIGEAVRLPILVARGMQDGPVLGFVAALHGNELNGIQVIQKLFAELDVSHLTGTVVGVLIANVPGLLAERREFNDAVDLNHIAPGRPTGDRSQVFIHRLIDRVVSKFEYLIDLHTASFGRVNTYYVRVDMANEASARMARLHYPDIILNNPASDYTLRGYASELGIKAITLELRDAYKFQPDVVEAALLGAKNVLYDLAMLPGKIVSPGEKSILCDRSYWIYTDEGGILDVVPALGKIVEEGTEIAHVRTIFGRKVRTVLAPERGIVIGKSINPINQTGSRILHLGINPREIPMDG
jgi:predicted deacylase